MTRRVDRIQTEEDLKTFATITANAYPRMGAVADVTTRLARVNEQDPNSGYWGLYEDGVMLGGMRLLDLSVNSFGTFVAAGGIGSVAVDLVHKKKKAARDMVIFALDQFAEQGAPLALLYPFRPDFYHQMGFGYGPKADLYRFSPAALPSFDGAGDVVYLTEADLPQLQDYYAAEAAARHGFCRRSEYEWRTLLGWYSGRMVGYRKDGRIHGYLTFSFRPVHEGNFLKNDLRLGEWLWDGPEALAALASFLRRQADQVGRVQFATHDPSFHFLLSDVGNGSDNLIPSVYHEAHTSGVGLMYRILSLEQFLAATPGRDFGGVTAEVALTVRDGFRPANAGEYRLRVERGHAEMRRLGAQGPGSTGVSGVSGSGARVAMGIDIAELSALLMGSVDVAGLYRVGKADVAAADVPLLQRLFRVDQQPQCVTSF